MFDFHIITFECHEPAKKHVCICSNCVGYNQQKSSRKKVDTHFETISSSDDDLLIKWKTHHSCIWFISNE
jgi:hypothetical protein